MARVLIRDSTTAYDQAARIAKDYLGLWLKTTKVRGILASNVHYVDGADQCEKCETETLGFHHIQGQLDYELSLASQPCEIEGQRRIGPYG